MGGILGGESKVLVVERTLDDGELRLRGRSWYKIRAYCDCKESGSYFLTSSFFHFLLLHLCKNKRERERDLEKARVR